MSTRLSKLNRCKRKAPDLVLLALTSADGKRKYPAFNFTKYIRHLSQLSVRELEFKPAIPAPLPRTIASAASNPNAVTRILNRILGRRTAPASSA